MVPSSDTVDGPAAPFAFLASNGRRRWASPSRITDHPDDEDPAADGVLRPQQVQQADEGTPAADDRRVLLHAFEPRPKVGGDEPVGVVAEADATEAGEDRGGLRQPAGEQVRGDRHPQEDRREQRATDRAHTADDDRQQDGQTREELEGVRE